MNEVDKKSRAIQNMTFIMNNMQDALQAEESYVIHGDPAYKKKFIIISVLCPHRQRYPK